MNAAELIECLLRSISQDFYKGRPQHFFRDQRALTQAIARYGAECHARGWEFVADSIRDDLLDLLRSIRKNKADITYLPVYLEGAVDRHIRMRAEELSAKAKFARSITESVMRRIQPAAVREATPVETLATLYKQLRQVKARRKSALKPSKKEAQQSLL